MEITNERTIKCFDGVCYHYCGTRWSDIGLLRNAVSAFNGLFVENPSVSVSGERVSSSSASGAYRNVANSEETSLVRIQNAGGSMICLTLSWYQLGGANITYEGRNMVSAGDRSITISDEFVSILNSINLF